jgi:hypothetical protein
MKLKLALALTLLFAVTAEPQEGKSSLGTRTMPQIASQHNLDLDTTTFSQLHAQLSVSDRVEDFKNLLKDPEIQRDDDAKKTIQNLVQGCPTCANIAPPPTIPDIFVPVVAGGARAPRQALVSNVDQMNTYLDQTIKQITNCQKGYYDNYHREEVSQHLAGQALLNVRVFAVYKIVHGGSACPY